MLPDDPLRAGPSVGVLTADSRGAIAVVRVWGSGALAVASEVFRPHRGVSLRETPPGRPRVGRVGLGVGDEVVAVVIDPENGAPEVEIQCHGGPAAVNLVVEALEAAGARRRPAGAWVAQRAGSPLRAQAEIDLPRAETVRAARVLLDQVGGALDQALERIADRLLGAPASAVGELAELVERAGVGTRLISGWRVVLAGRPNVGKSRLLNAIAGFGRSIVSPTPGTTRDVVTVRTAIDGWPVELADTAGLRATDDPIEAGGVALARKRQGLAELVLVVLDCSEPLTAADRDVLARHPGALIVVNKADLPALWEPLDEWGSVAIVSAERGDGLDRLLPLVARRLVPAPPPPGSAVPFRPEHARLLRRALRLAQGGREMAAHRAVERLRRLGR